MEMLAHLLTRRSVKSKHLVHPGPDEEQLKQVLTAGMRSPDHGKLAPWRIKVLHQDGQKALGELYAERFAAVNPDANDKQIAFERERATCSPLLIAVLCTPIMGRIPVWEQELSAGAVCMNILHAAHALGFAGDWITGWMAFDPEIKYALGGTLEDKIAGFIHIGTPGEKPQERERPHYDDIVDVWTKALNNV